jgi:hypothetical protein
MNGVDTNNDSRHITRMNAQIHIIWSLKAVLLALVFGALLVQAPSAHASMVNENVGQIESGDMHQHEQSDMVKTAGADCGSSINSTIGGHHDGECCSGMCLTLALINLSAIGEPETGSAQNGFVPPALVSSDIQVFLRPPSL